MPKANPLSKGLAKTAKSKSKTNGAAAAPTGDQRPHRAGRMLIGGHFTEDVHRALKMICVEERTTIVDLMAEGINAVFANRNLPTIATTPREASAEAAGAA